MRALKRTTEDNLITIHFGRQEALEVAVEEENPAVQEEGMTCENGVCMLNWTPKRPAKKSEAA